MWRLISKRFSQKLQYYKLTNHELYLQKVRKSTLSVFDEKRRYMNEIGSMSWN